MVIPYQKILDASVGRLRLQSTPMGLERILQEEMAVALPAARREVRLAAVSAETIFGTSAGSIDLVHKQHGIEVKVVQFPRAKAVPSNALYDIGQLSSDYWRLAHAKTLTSGELLVLLCGPLVASLAKATAICREFHNRMYVDYQTSAMFGELSVESDIPHRKRQVSAIQRMGLNVPANDGRRFKTVVSSEFALLSVPVVRQ